jgi:membrane protease YdiL (CAAX protease family)
MLPEKRWKLDAVLRLLLSVFVCYFSGSILVAVIQSLSTGKKITAGFILLAIAAVGCLTAIPLLARKPWTLENFTRRMITMLVCFWAGLMCGSLTLKLAGPLPTVLSAVQLTVAILSFQGALLLLLPVFLRENEATFTEAFGWSNQWVHALMYGIIAACIFLPVGQALQWISVQAMEHIPNFPLKPEEQSAVQTVRNSPSWSHRAVLGIGTIAVAPLAEEILFRGILYPWIKGAGFPRLALWVTALAFGAVHMNLMNFLPLFLLAVVLTLLYEKTNNLVAPIAAHSLFNAVNFIMLLVQTRPI